jgi:hypothetical protein
VLVTIKPAPVSASEEYEITTFSLTEAYGVPFPASVVGQWSVGGAQALTIKFSIVPRGTQSEEQ